ncbi:MAG TPA: DNA repair protein RecN [Longimicrobiales bacterium]|nr:DNA repair protein RecN [Longimicrobiales bacterium]
MLVELRIRDYAVVEDLTLSLGPGLNALTGETGAGKSIIVGALSLLLGERASSGVVRVGAERATVEAVFDLSALPGVEARLEELGFRPEDGHLILRREVASEGRNRAWVNGSPATAGIVGELGSALVDLHGQHEHQTLLRPAEQRGILDAFAAAQEMARAVAEQHDTVRTLRRELEEHETRVREVESKADFLRFQLEEIDGARLHPGEDEALESESRRHEHSEELAEGTAGIHDALYAGEEALADRLAEVRARLNKLVRFDPGLGELVTALEAAYHAVSDVGRRVGEYATQVEHDPRRLEEVRRRLDLIFRLKRKYGPELADILATGQRVRTELRQLEEADHDLGELRKRLAVAGRALEAAAGRLTELRSGAALDLARAVDAVLPDLGLTGATFQVHLRPLEEIGAHGSEAVAFMVAPNAGFDPLPLNRIASGGELSRVMLALKSILAGVDKVPVLVFDEIDAGIGGVVATAVARKLDEVARRHQVFVVTHLPQIASRANAHLLVEKKQDRGTTTTTVRVLTGEERIEEVARMLGGDPESATSRKHAQELLAAG